MLSELGATPEEMLPLAESTYKHDLSCSSDMGNCTYITPGIQSLFAINAKGNLHTAPFREAAGLDFAHAEALRAGKANAFLGVDVLMSDTFYGQVRNEWEATMTEAGRL